MLLSFVKNLFYSQRISLSTTFLYAWRSCLCQTRFQSFKCFHHCGLAVRLPCCLCATMFSLMAGPRGIEPLPTGSKPVMISISPKPEMLLVPPPGYDPGSSDFQSVAMTTSAKAALNCLLAEASGIEPLLTSSKPVVLPLHHAPTNLFGIPPGTRTPTNGFGDRHAAITPGIHKKLLGVLLRQKGHWPYQLRGTFALPELCPSPYSLADGCF